MGGRKKRPGIEVTQRDLQEADDYAAGLVFLILFGVVALGLIARIVWAVLS